MSFVTNADTYLEEIITHLKSKNIKLSKKTSDGRTNSAINENEIIKTITKLNSQNKSYYILDAITRDWADLYLISKNSQQEYKELEKKALEYKQTKSTEKSKKNRLKKEWNNILKNLNQKKHLIPVNIKITETLSNDNINAKEGLYFSLTGEIYTGSNNWNSFLRKLKENLPSNEPEVDYYFLIVNKNNTQDIFYNSLRRINSFVPNGNNPPFQVKWCENKIPQKTDFKTAKEKILKTLEETLYQRALPWFAFQKNFPEFIAKRAIEISNKGTN